MLIIQIYKRIIQQNKRLFLLEKGINQRKSHAEHNTVHCSSTEIINFSCFALFVHMDGQIMVYKCFAEIVTQQFMYIRRKVPFHAANILI